MNLEKRVVQNTFLKFFFPTVASSLILSVISMTDLIVAGHFLNEMALSAISLALPVVIYSMILGALFGMGGAIQLSVQMGKGNRDQCNRIFTTAMVSVFVITLLSAAVGLIFLDPLLKLLGASGVLMTEARGYIGVLVAGIPFMTISSVMVTYLRNDNEQRYAMVCVTIAGILNLALSIFFVTAADLGTMGISLGSVMAEMICCVLASFRLFSKRRMIRIIKMKPDIHIFLSILHPGMPLAVIFASQIIMTIVINRRLGQLGGGEGIAIYGVIKYLINFMFAFFDGITGSIQPMLGIYYGEKERENVKTTADCGVAAMAAVAVAMFLLMMFGGRIICGIFDLTGETMVRESLFALHVLAFYCPVIAFITFLNGFYRCTGKSNLAFIISIMDNFFFPIPTVLYFSSVFGVRGIWFGILGGGICSCILILGICFFSKKGILMTDQELVRPDGEFSMVYPAQREKLPEILEQVEDFCDRSGIGPKQYYYINLIIEELVVNVITMARNSGHLDYVDVRIKPEESDRVTVRIRDNLTWFDPTESSVGNLGAIMEGYLADEEICYDGINDLGLGIIKKIATEYNYRRTIGYNNFLVTI